MISIKNADKYFNRRKSSEIHVINHLSLSLPEKGFIAITGRSGCGKTTLLNAIGGLDRLGSGTIEVCGNNIAADTDDVRNKLIGYVLQNYCLIPSLTVGENVLSSLRIAGFTDKAESRKRVIAALKNVGMEKFINRYPDALSGGQQQRVAIARAIVKNPAVILADEPTGNLDHANTLAVMDILKEISASRLVVMVTHEVELAEIYCDRIITLSDGRIVSDSETPGTSVSDYKKDDGNTVYLGDLECSSYEIGNITLHYYGETTEKKAEIRIINHNGVFFLQSNGIPLKIAGEKNSLKINEGKKIREKATLPSGGSSAMSELPPLPESRKTGRLFDLKTALLSAFKYTFSPKKRRIKMLFAIMFCLSFVITATSAVSAKTLYYFGKTEQSYSDRIIFLNFSEEEEKPLNSELSGLVGKNGIESIFPVWYFSETDQTHAGKSSLSFSYGGFNIYRNSSLSFGSSGFYLPITAMESHLLLAGTDKITSDTETVITKGVADAILSYSYQYGIDSYDDLIGLKENHGDPIDENYYDFVRNNSLEIVGIISENSPCYYVSDIQYAYRYISQQYSMKVYPYSLLSDPGFDSPEPGSAVVNISSSLIGDKVNTEDPASDSITISGLKFNISQKAFFYRDSVKECMAAYGFDEDKSDDEWILFLSSMMPNANQEYMRSYLPLAKMIYRLQFAGTFRKSLEEASFGLHTDDSYYVLDNGEFSYDKYTRMVVSSAGLDDIKPVYSEDPETLYALAMLFYDEHQRWPAINGYINNDGNLVKSDKLWYEFKNDFLNRKLACEKYLPESDPSIGYLEYFSKTGAELNVGSSFLPIAVLSDQDYMSLLYNYGKNDMLFGGFDSGSSALGILSADLSRTENFLKENYKGAYVYTPEYIKNQITENLYEELISQAIPTLVILAVLGICMYFIMRTGLLTRVREIAVFRVIGVKKSNLRFLFFAESLVIFFITVFPGYLITSIVLNSASSPVTRSVFYYPFYIAFACFAYLFLCIILFGVLPVSRLLRKTPSQLLTRYDI